LLEINTIAILKVISHFEFHSVFCYKTGDESYRETTIVREYSAAPRRILRVNPIKERQRERKENSRPDEERKRKERENSRVAEEKKRREKEKEERDRTKRIQRSILYCIYCSSSNSRAQNKCKSCDLPLWDSPQLPLRVCRGCLQGNGKSQ
jgi:hypothetical protein